MKACDCGAELGEVHVSGCDTEECPYCGKQLIVCGCIVPLDDRIPWDGVGVRAAAAISKGWFVRLVIGGETPCEPIHPGAVPDINKVVKEMVWDRNQKKWGSDAKHAE